MPLQKFRSLEEAERALWTTGGSAENLRRLDSLYRFWSLRRRSLPWRGVRRYRTIEDANAEAYEWLGDPLRLRG